MSVNLTHVELQHHTPVGSLTQPSAWAHLIWPPSNLINRNDLQIFVGNEILLKKINLFYTNNLIQESSWRNLSMRHLVTYHILLWRILSGTNRILDSFWTNICQAVNQKIFNTSSQCCMIRLIFSRKLAKQKAVKHTELELHAKFW